MFALYNFDAELENELSIYPGEPLELVDSCVYIIILILYKKLFKRLLTHHHMFFRMISLAGPWCATPGDKWASYHPLILAMNTMTLHLYVLNEYLKILFYTLGTNGCIAKDYSIRNDY